MKNKNREDIENEIQELLKYISEKKKIQNSFNNEYKELSKNFVPVTYRKKRFLDIIFRKKYIKFQEDYQKSEKTNNKLKELDTHILILQEEIETLENYLYSLQYKFSEFDSNDNIKNINEDDKEPFDRD